MNVAIDVSPLESGHKLRGIGSYTEQLVEALKKYKSEHSYSFFTRGQRVPENGDLVHYPYFDPFFLTLPLLKTKPTVVTVHDLVPIVYPKYFPRGLRGQLKWQVQKLSLRGADAIITDSKASQYDIAQFTHVSPSKIEVVYLAPSSIFSRLADNKTLQKVKKHFSLPKIFILYVGDVNWNKNVKGLLRAFDLVRRTISAVKLILVGRQFLNNTLPETAEFDHVVHELSLDSHIRRLGFVENKNLAALYTLASVYIQPSFAEGFGLPILEAMACGCPVVCGDTSSLSEIAGPSRLVNPLNIEDVADGILNVLELKKPQRESMMEQGLLWVKRFNWRKVAEETARVYESIVA